jgi:hypothetical protein
MSKDELLALILPEVTAEFNQLAEHLSSATRTPSVEEIEVSLRQVMLRLGGKLIEQIVALEGYGKEGTRTKCACGEMAAFEGYRPKTITTMIGVSRIERAYYYCGSCRSGFAPIDSVLGIGSGTFSAAVERGVCSLASVEPFEKVSEHLYDLSAVSVSAKAVQLASESRGARVAEEECALVDAVFRDEEQVEAQDHPEVLCIGLDGKIVSLLDRGRELKVASIYELVRPKDGTKTKYEPGKTTYLGMFSEPGEFGRHVWVEAMKRGALAARALIVLGDGAPWIWNLAAEHFPDAVQILDIYHAKEHIWGLGGVLYGEGSKKTKRFAEYKCRQIEAGKVGKVISALGKLDVADEKKRKKLRVEIGYFNSNRCRMNYPKYRKAGYHIGSGMVESACKQFGARLDAAGMRWIEAGAGAIAALRALWLSDKWQAYWKPVRPPLYA